MRSRLVVLASFALSATPLAAQKRVASGDATVRARPAAAAAYAPVADTAIARLEGFLERYPTSALRPTALFQLAELLVRRADEAFAVSQRGATTTAGDTAARAGAAERPDYAAAIARYEELVRSHPEFERIEAASYTLGTLYGLEQRWADAVPHLERVAAGDSSGFEAEALFRLGDAHFELAAQERGEPRRQRFASAAAAYQRATEAAPQDGDIYYLSLYKLGWAYYNQATQTSQREYEQAVDVFGRLVDAYDRLSPDRQARLGLRGESIDYMAVAFTQVGGAEAANRYFAARGGAPYKVPVLRRVAESLRDQGDFSRAITAYRTLIAEAPTDSGALTAQREIVDIYQNRVLDPEQAQAARLALVDMFAPGAAWASANPTLADSAATAREEALRLGGQYALARAQQESDRARHAAAAAIYRRYLDEFARADSARAVRSYHAEALFGAGEFLRAGTEYVQAAYGYGGEADAFGEQAGRNSVVAFDSALARAPGDRAAQDSLFAAAERFAEAYPRSDAARTALVLRGQRASQAQRWDVMEATFRRYAERYPDDPFAGSAQRLVGDALFRQGRYADAQTQWERAQALARQTGRATLADTIATVRRAAAASFADTLIRAGEYRRAAEDVYVAYAERNADLPEAADALRNAIETWMLADSAARRRGDEAASREARERAAALSATLTDRYRDYQYRAQYQRLRASLLADLGRREDEVGVLRQLVAENPGWAGRADAMVRLAVALDSLGRDREAAEAYEAFAAAFPSDRRAADAQYNAAVTYAESRDEANAARAYGTFATRFASDPRASEARTTRLALLRSTGDTTTAVRELASLCESGAPDELRAECAARAGEAAFSRGRAMFPEYQAIELAITSRAQLTAAGVQRLSSRKQQMLREMTAHFTRAIESGSPEHLAAATYYVGLAQWEYGNFLANVRLPAELSEAEREAAQTGSSRQAEQYYEAARSTWRQLVEKAGQDRIDNVWVTRARDAVAGNVPDTPPGGEGDRQ